MHEHQSEVFISYAWGGDSEKIVNELEVSLQNKGLTIIRDKRDLGFKGLITDFMKKIGEGRAVVAVISDKYLRSPYCMFELMELYRNKDFAYRIFPIVLKDAAIFNPKEKLKYYRYWREKKVELETAIEASGIEAITVVGDDYKIYHKVFSNFGEVINVLEDINALTPQMHQASDFKELYQALIKSLDEDSKYTRYNDIQKLLKQLSTGSQQYYKELTGIHGPYHHLNISEAILAGISQVADQPFTTGLLTTVKDKGGREFPLENCLQEFWRQEKQHIILLGDGGMGKTVSLIHFWETLLINSQKNREATIPIFIALHQYNSVSENQRESFIAKRIAWHYLGITETRGETVDALWQAFKTNQKDKLPNIVLLLDGFNEVTGEKTQLLLELQELHQKGKSVQIVLTSRYEMNFTWAEGFQRLELQPLDEVTVKAYLQTRNASYPEDQRLQQILQNPMMLTLYAGSSEIVERYKGNKQFDFKPHTTTQGELLWNYLEAQIVKLANTNIYGLRAVDFYYYKFLIRHFLPYLGYEMEIAGYFEFEEKQMKKMVGKACRHFYTKEFIEAFPEYSSWLKYFDLKELDFAEEAERFDKINKALCSDLCLMKGKRTVYEFLHQNFRDYFSAAHLLNELKTELHRRGIPEVLTHRSLPVYIRRFVGQITGEHYQTEAPSLPPTILMQTLDTLRGVFDEKIGYAVWNIVNIWRDTRFHLGGTDLSGLDLQGTGFQDIFCYRRHHNMYNSAGFDKSLISEKSFLPQGHSWYVDSITFHPDGKTFISGSWDKTIKAWDLETGQCLATFQGHNDVVSSVAFHLDGKTFISGSVDRTIKAWDFRTGECIATFQEHNDIINSVSFHPDGKTFISGSKDKTIKAWNLETGECIATFQGHVNSVRSVAFDPDGKTFISGSKDKTIKAWDLETGKCLVTFKGHSSSVRSVAFHPDGKTFISGSKDNTIKAWDLETGECMTTFQGHGDYVRNVDFHPDGKTFISCSRDNTIKAWDLSTGECLATFQGHGNSVRSVAFNPDGKTLVSGSLDRTIKAWDLKTGECLATFQGHRGYVESVAIHPNGKTFISGSWDKTIKAWDLSTGVCLATFKGHSDYVSSVAFHPEGKTFISGSSDNTLKAWDLKTGECLATFEGHNSSVYSVAFHPDGKIFVSGSFDKTIKAWDLKTGECLATFRGHYSSVESVAFHPDGKTFISGSYDKTVKAWDLMTEECLATFREHHTFQGDNGHVSCVAFHPNGKTFISGLWDRTIKAWSLKTGECLATFYGHYSSVESVAFHPDGKTFISGSSDNTIKAWNLKTGECLATFQGHNNSVYSVAFHPDGGTFISGSYDNTIKAWDLKTGECLATMISVPGLLVAGCSFMNLHSNSQLSEEAKNAMRQHGAIFNEDDKRRWHEAVVRVFGE